MRTRVFEIFAEVWRKVVQPSSDIPPASSALIRVGLAMIIWARFGSDHILVRTWTLPDAGLAFAFHASVAAYAVGFHTRRATLCLFVVLFAMVHLWGIELGRSAWNYHHTRLLVIAVAASYFTPAGELLSVDSLRDRASASARDSVSRPQSMHGLMLMRVQLTVIYGWSVYFKLDPTFMGGERLTHLYMQFYAGSAPVGLAVTWLCAGLAWVVIAAEAFLAFGLWLPRLRSKAIVLGLMMHSIFFFTLEVSCFSATMCLLYLAFLPPERVDQTWTRIAAGQPR